MEINALDQLEKTTVLHEEFNKGLTLIKRQYDIRLKGYERSQGVAIFGESGTGKSRLLETFKNTYPSKDLETVSEKPIIYFKVPPNPTGGSICSAILEGLGDDYCNARAKEQEKRGRIVNLINECKVSVMIIDEIQHLSHHWGEVRNKDAANTIKLIGDDTNIMIVLSGLEYGSALLKHTELARRFSTNIYLNRFSWTDEDSRKQFKAYLNSLQKKITDIDLIDITNNKVAFMIYVASGGLPGLIFNLLKEAFIYAISINKNEVGLHEFAEVFKQIHPNNESLVNPFKSDLLDINHLIKQAENINLEEAPKRKRRRAAN